MEQPAIMQNSTHPDVPGLDLSEIPGRKNEKIPADKSLVRKLAIQGEEVEEYIGNVWVWAIKIGPYHAIPTCTGFLGNYNPKVCSSMPRSDASSAGG